METLTFTDKDLKFKLPFGMIISGASGSGKSSFIRRLIAENASLIDPAPKSVLYCYGEMSELVPILHKSGIDVYAGVPNDQLIKSLPKPALIILDDMILSISEAYLSELFVKKSHHQQFAIVMVTQNLFDKKIKVARLNAQYLVLLRSPNSLLAIRNAGVQLFPKQLDYFLDAYRKATEQLYGHLIVDMHPASHSSLKLRSCIFSDDPEHFIFIPKNAY